MADQNEHDKDPELKKRPGCLFRLVRAFFVFLLLLTALLTWFNGPGMRWLGPKIAQHFMGKTDFSGSFRLNGTLLGGIEVYDLDLVSPGSLERLVIDRLQTDYRFREVIKGKIRSISGEGVHVDLRLIEKEKEESQPIDFAQLGKTLNNLREKIVPVNIDLEDMSVSVKKDGELIVGIEESGLSHEVNDDLIELNIGRITDAAGRSLEPQDSKIVWDPGKLTIDRLDVLPIVGINNLEILLPEDGDIAATGNIRLDEAVLRLDIGSGIKDVRLDLAEGAVDFDNVRESFGLESLPLSGRLTSLALELQKVFPEWQEAVGSAELFVEGFSFGDWGAPELALGARLNDGDISAKLTGRALETGFSITANTAFERSKLESEGFLLGTVDGDLSIERVALLLGELNNKLELGQDFAEFPQSDLGGNWVVKFKDGVFDSVITDLLLNPSEEKIAPITLRASYQKDLLKITELATRGLSISGEYDIAGKTYQMNERMTEFNTESIAPWLNGSGIVLPGDGVFSMEWNGTGDLGEKTHTGEVRNFSGLWQWDEIEGEPVRAPIGLEFDADYAWPERVAIENLVADTEGQQVTLDAVLAEDFLTLEKFSWANGEDEIATGAGRLPVPEDFSRFKEFLANDSRPLDLEIHTKTLPLTLFRPWVKGLEQIDERANARLDLTIAGSLAEPVVEAQLDIKDISTPERSEIPPTDLEVEMSAADGVAKISAEAIAKDYAPAVLKAEMPFLPKQWAEDPESLQSSEISGKLDFPRLDLSRFIALVPGAKRLDGVITGDMTIAGTLGEPAIDGNIKLSGGTLHMKSETVPDINGINLNADANLERLELEGSVSDIEGGTLRLESTVQLKNEAGEGLGDIEVSIRGEGLPLVRNDFLLMRANADLSLSGTLANARLTVEVGIVDSVFYKDMDLIPIGKPFLEPSAASLPKVDTPSNPGSAVPSPFDDWTIDIAVRTIDPILIRGNLGTGSVNVGLRLEGTLGDPRPNGKVRIEDAVARLPFSTLSIRQGFLTFTPSTGFDPILEIRGFAEPRPYQVEVYAYGRASDPQLLLTSQPPLPENEIMTLLATGTTAEGLEDSQAASSRTTQLLIEELRRGRFLFGKQLRPVLGLLDNVDFSLAEEDPYDSDSYTSATLKISEKWFISAGFSEDGDQRALATWRLRFR
ncbi:translocation/assembly module TamB domain-containing protein [Luteolibacter algae]|uniref:Translocation/assembly module TamB domain-containing protein n=1 Tax=Luteolibacter algae TaxID=454151 RepID=A0ABW5DBT2_9BACT